MVLVAAEVLSVGSKPPAAVGVRISKGEKHGFGAAALFSTKASFLQERAGGSTFSPKFVEQVGSIWALFAEQLSSCFA